MPQANNQSITPALPRALSSDARKKVEAAVEAHLTAVQALTAFLDTADGDPDLEPSLAGTHGDDREYDPADPPDNEGIDENELDGPEGIDDEPELGWPATINQDRALKSCGSTYLRKRRNCRQSGGRSIEPSLQSQFAFLLGRHTPISTESNFDKRRPKPQSRGNGSSHEL